MGLIAKLEQRNADLERRVAHLEKAFDGLYHYAMTKMPPFVEPVAACGCTMSQKLLGDGCAVCNPPSSGDSNA